MNKLFIFLAVFFFMLSESIVNAQTYVKKSIKNNLLNPIEIKPSNNFSLPLFKKFVPSENETTNWGSTVKLIELKEHGLPEVKAIKASKIERKNEIRSQNITSKYNSSQKIQTLVNRNFDALGSVFSTPPDNSLAISNDGTIITVNNDGFEAYDENGNLIFGDLWFDFYNGNFTSTIFDPRVIYDSGEDKFIFLALNGFTSQSSQLLVSFTVSSNISDGWFTYTIPGNILENGTWFDFPNIGLSDEDLFITGNLFTDQDFFDQVIVHQINKESGYTGQTLIGSTYSDIETEALGAFTLVPATLGSQGNYGPGIFLVSSEPFGSNQIILYEVTDNLSNNPSLISTTISTEEYSPSPNAFQSGTSNELDNGDNRIQSAFYQSNGMLHFVLHSDIGDGYNGLHYNRLNVNTLENTTKTFGESGVFDFAYPVVASVSNSDDDNSVVIGYLKTGTDIFPQIGAINVNNKMEFSTPVTVFEGNTFIDIIQGEFERWGDYNGVSRRYNATEPTVWFSGGYGGNLTQRQNTYVTRIAEIGTFSATSISKRDILIDETQIYPNPVYDFFELKFNANNHEKITIELYNNNAQLVKKLYSGDVKKGENRFSFNKNALTAGTYFLLITNETSLLKNEKIVIANN